MAAWTNCLSNESPPWAAYRAITTARLVSLDKFPGVIPVGTREVCQCIITKLVIQDGRAQAKEACGRINLCSGIEAGIEGLINAVREQEYMGRGVTEEERG